MGLEWESNFIGNLRSRKEQTKKASELALGFKSISMDFLYLKQLKFAFKKLTRSHSEGVTELESSPSLGFPSLPAVRQLPRLLGAPLTLSSCSVSAPAKLARNATPRVQARGSALSVLSPVSVLPTAAPPHPSGLSSRERPSQTTQPALCPLLVSGAPAIDDHNLVAYDNRSVVSRSSGGQRSEIKVSAGPRLSGGSRGRICSMPSSSFLVVASNPWHSLACKTITLISVSVITWHCPLCAHISLIRTPPIGSGPILR